MCFVRERLESKVMPRLRASEEGLSMVPLKVTDGERTLFRCCGVPIKRNSVFEGFTERRLAVNHVWAASMEEVSSRRDFVRSLAENVMYSWVSSA